MQNTLQALHTQHMQNTLQDQTTQYSCRYIKYIESIKSDISLQIVVITGYYDKASYAVTDYILELLDMAYLIEY